MWLLSPPSSERIRLFLDEQRGLDFSYPKVGHSLDRSPAGYNLDHDRVSLRHGEVVFAAGCAALRQ